MPVLVHLVVIWDLLSPAFVAKKSHRGDAWILIMIVDGAVDKFAVIFFPVGNTLVSEVVMRAYVEVVKS
jgi:hypothetical protein